MPGKLEGNRRMAIVEMATVRPLPMIVPSPDSAMQCRRPSGVCRAVVLLLLASLFLLADCAAEITRCNAAETDADSSSQSQKALQAAQQLRAHAFESLFEGRFDEARDFFSKCVGQLEANLAADDWNLKIARLDLAAFVRLSELNEEHAASALDALKTFRLAAQQMDAGRPKSAVSNFHAAISQWKQSVGDGNIVLCRMLEASSQCQSTMKNYLAAAELLHEDLEIQQALVGVDNGYYAQTLNALAVAEMEIGKFAEAEVRLKAAHKVCANVLGTNSDGAINSTLILAQLFIMKGEPKLAEPFALDAVETSSRGRPANAVIVIHSKYVLAKCFAKQRQLRRAETIFKELIPNLADQKCGVNAQTAADIAEGYAALLWSFEQSDDAIQFSAWGRALRARGCGVPMPKVPTPTVPQ